MNWILIVAYVTSVTGGTGYAFENFETEQACKKAQEWVQKNNFRTGQIRTICLEKK